MEYINNMYILTKEKDGELSYHKFHTEFELKEHLIAMWKFTDWHLVSIVQQVGALNIEINP